MSTSSDGEVPHAVLPTEVLGPRVARLAGLLEEVTRRTVTLGELWALWAQADPTSTGRPERRAALADALDRLAAARLVVPSQSLDRTAVPHLPTRVRLPAPAPTPSAAALAWAVPWRPELAWVVGARLTVGQVEQLRRINTWLRDHGRDADVLPLRERSLQVLGHEKALDRLVSTSLFGPGRLTTELLRTFRTHPPLPVVRVGTGPVLLVVENDETFHSVRTALAAGGPGAVGGVAWGAGGAFEASVRSTADLAGITRVRYFGDLDADGLRIPRSAAETARREGLAVVEPAAGLYRALLGTRVRQPGQPLVETAQALALAGWIARADADLAPVVRDLLVAGVRVPQEALCRTLLTADRGWVDGL